MIKSFPGAPFYSLGKTLKALKDRKNLQQGAVDQFLQALKFIADKKKPSLSSTQATDILSKIYQWTPTPPSQLAILSKEVSRQKKIARGPSTWKLFRRDGSLNQRIQTKKNKAIMGENIDLGITVLRMATNTGTMAATGQLSQMMDKGRSAANTLASDGSISFGKLTGLLSSEGQETFTKTAMEGAQGLGALSVALGIGAACVEVYQASKYGKMREWKKSLINWETHTLMEKERSNHHSHSDVGEITDDSFLALRLMINKVNNENYEEAFTTLKARYPTFKKRVYKTLSISDADVISCLDPHKKSKLIHMIRTKIDQELLKTPHYEAKFNQFQQNLPSKLQTLHNPKNPLEDKQKMKYELITCLQQDALYNKQRCKQLQLMAANNLIGAGCGIALAAGVSAAASVTPPLMAVALVLSLSEKMVIEAHKQIRIKGLSEKVQGLL